jgi:hypothetical protein
MYLATGNFIWVCENPFGGIDSLPTWNRISNDLITQNLSGGKKKYFTAITASGGSDHTVYVGTNNGEVFRIMNANEPSLLCVDTDVQRIDGGNLPKRWITDIEVDPTNHDNLILTFGAFGAGDDRVYLSNDAMAASPSFHSIQGNLDPTLPVFSAAFYPDPNHKMIVIGTQEGVFGTNSNYEGGGSVTWTDESNGIGAVAVTDVNFRKYYMEYLNSANYKYSKDYTLFIATHGRGAFKSSTLVARPEAQDLSQGITVKAGPNPTVNSCKITFDLPMASDVQISVFGLDGRPVAELANGHYGQGASDITFETKQLPAGMYLVKAAFDNTKGKYQTALRIVVVR